MDDYLIFQEWVKTVMGKPFYSHPYDRGGVAYYAWCAGREYEKGQA